MFKGLPFKILQGSFCLLTFAPGRSPTVTRPGHGDAPEVRSSPLDPAAAVKSFREDVRSAARHLRPCEAQRELSGEPWNEMKGECRLNLLEHSLGSFTVTV